MRLNQPTISSHPFCDSSYPSNSTGPIGSASTKYSATSLDRSPVLTPSADRSEYQSATADRARFESSTHRPEAFLYPPPSVDHRRQQPPNTNDTIHRMISSTNEYDRAVRERHRHTHQHITRYKLHVYQFLEDARHFASQTDGLT